MKLGLFSESGNRLSSVAADAFQEDLDEIILADDLGFQEVWIAEPNHVRPNTVTHAHMLMCKAAGLTRQIRFASGVRQLPLHHPVDIVQEANMCDQITQGRYTFGYGGTHLVSKEQLRMRGWENVSDDDTRAMVHESIDLILKCWTSSAPFDHHGRFWQGTDVHVLPEPFQKPHPPIASGCSGSTDTLELAARHNFIPVFGRPPATAQDIRRWGETYLHTSRAARHTAARSAFRVAHIAYVAETDQQARDDVRDELTRRVRQAPHPYYAQWIPPGKMADDLSFDYLTDISFYWVGSPDTVYRQIKEYYDESGGFGVLLLMGGVALPTPEKAEQSWRLFAREVAPRLAVLDPDDGLVKA